MSNFKKALMASAAGGGVLNVEDVFSTYLYDGTGATQTITNGIDLDGEGGLIFFKDRVATSNWAAFDTERGVQKRLIPNATNAEYTANGTTIDMLSAFNSDGFTLGSHLTANTNGGEFASWTWRKAPRFFDCITYTGNGVAGRTVSHNLNADVGMMIIRKYSSTQNWYVFHKDMSATTPENRKLKLNGDAAVGGDQGTTYLNSTLPTSTTITLGSNDEVNGNGSSYVMYLFAHNDGDGDFGPTGDQDIIKCGSYTGNGSANGPEIDLGFEAQFVIVKAASRSGDWEMHDTMRGMTLTSDALLRVNLLSAESSLTVPIVSAESTGFKIRTNDAFYNGSGETYIYVAIRRGPMAVPESATDVFALDGSQSSTEPSFSSSFPVDFGIMYSSGTNSQTPWWFNRLTGTKYLKPIVATSEDTSSQITLDHMDGWGNRGFSSTDWQSHMFRRAPNFMDVVAYKGLGGNQGVPHNLGATPEFIIIKNRQAGFNWKVKHTGMGLKETTLNGTSAESGSDYWQSGDDADVFYTRTSNDNFINGTSYEYIAYLFASLDGVSKVGSYTGNGSGSGQNQTIDCGFASTPRLVVIKNVSRYRYWYYWDSLTGIVAGSEERNYWNRYQVDSALDLLDPTSSGFIANWNSAADESMNNSGEKYIYLAIA